VGYPPGATSDILTRILADGMSKRLNQPVVVENRAGAGGQLGNLAVKSAPADGTTLLMTPVATMSIFPHSYAGQLKYDPFKDFAPVAHLTNFQIGFGLSNKVPASNLKEYIDWVKSAPSQNAFFGSASNQLIWCLSFSYVLLLVSPMQEHLESSYPVWSQKAGMD
jgi:tripartite-type tricarboxylate transporter receptor subunit TctC